MHIVISTDLNANLKLYGDSLFFLPDSKQFRKTSIHFVNVALGEMRVFFFFSYFTGGVQTAMRFTEGNVAKSVKQSYRCTDNFAYIQNNV